MIGREDGEREDKWREEGRRRIMSASSQLGIVDLQPITKISLIYRNKHRRGWILPLIFNTQRYKIRCFNPFYFAKENIVMLFHEPFCFCNLIFFYDSWLLFYKAWLGSLKWNGSMRALIRNTGFKACKRRALYEIMILFLVHGVDGFNHIIAGGISGLGVKHDQHSRLLKLQWTINWLTDQVNAKRNDWKIDNCLNNINPQHVAPSKITHIFLAKKRMQCPFNSQIYFYWRLSFIIVIVHYAGVYEKDRVEWLAD